MTPSSRHTARRRVLAAMTLGATAVAGSALLAPGTSHASSHREAPFTASDPAIDNTDVYAFTSPDKPSTATLIADWTPFQEPAGGPNFYPWATDATYDINIDNNGDAKPDITYRWTFTDVDKRGTTNHGDTAVPGTFLYNDGPVTSFEDENLLFKQTYKLERIAYTYPAGVATAASTTLLTAAQVAPSNVGTASIPDYDSLRDEAITSGTIGTGPTQSVSYVGQIADPFFLDLRVFDLLYGADLKETAFNTLKNYNVNTIAYQVPKSDLAAAGDATANPVIGVWSVTSRHTTRTLAATDSSGAESTSPNNDPLAQVSRLGNPLVNEAVVPAQLKDLFNRSTPAQDVSHGFAGKVQDPELPGLISSIYKIPNPNLTTAGKNRPDLVAAFLTGISKKAAAGTDYSGLSKGSPDLDLNSLDLNAVANGATAVAQQPAEYLRLNLSTPVALKPNRLGVLGNDVQGFPNGRRLSDDVVDIALQALEGILVSDTSPAVKTAVSGLGDGVNGPDRPYLATFPYVADPYSGSDQHNGTTVLFRQVFTSHGGFIQAGIQNLSSPQPGATAELYRKNDATGAYDKIATEPLNTAGTATQAAVNVPQKKGTAAVYTWKIIINHGTAAGVFPGISVKVSSF